MPLAIHEWHPRETEAASLEPEYHPGATGSLRVGVFRDPSRFVPDAIITDPASGAPHALWYRSNLPGFGEPDTFNPIRLISPTRECPLETYRSVSGNWWRLEQTAEVVTSETFPGSLLTRHLLSEADTEALLDDLAEASPMESIALHDRIVRNARAADVLGISLRQHQRHGTERWLIASAAILRDMGAHAWPVLRDLARLPIAESEAFVGAILQNGEVTLREKVNALVDLALNFDAGVRARVLEATSILPPGEAEGVLRVLADAHEDEVAREAASSLPPR